MPADEEGRRHAEHLLYEYRRRLRVRERQKVRLGDAADPAVDMEIAELRTNIALLEPVVEPEPSEEVREAVRRHIADDYLFVFRQVVKVTQRMALREQHDAVLADEIQQIKVAAETDRAERPRRQEELDGRFDRQDRLLRGIIAVLSVVAFVVLILVLRAALAI